jgi:hypothetical protein
MAALQACIVDAMRKRTHLVQGLLLHGFFGIFPSSWAIAEPAAGALPRAAQDCLPSLDALPAARLDAAGRISGLPAKHVGPMQLVAPPALRFDRAVVAIRSLQQRGGRLYIVALDASGKRVMVPVSLETDLTCSPLRASGECPKSPSKRTPGAVDGGVPGGVLAGVVGGVLESSASGAASQAPSGLAPSLIEIAVLEGRARIRADRPDKLRTVPLHELGSALQGLLKQHPVAPILYVNATGQTPWQQVVTALAASHCVLQAADEQGFDAVLIGRPATLE